MVNLYHSHVVMNEQWSHIGIHNSQASVARQQLFPSVKAQVDGFLVDSWGKNPVEEKNSFERALIGSFRWKPDHEWTNPIRHDSTD